ncbi:MULTISPECIES: SGNH/GDSL hydrolase family protein [unclassified Rhizobium]|uniref:SGNH/GDSL hydrolase family protein n=1 Tax=unclassified Rhizobium TaxID=2613769 RepID=UPI003819BE9A
MRTVLCFGDSNTHGQIPGGTPLDRYPVDERWPGILKAALGDGWHVIEEGLSGRTTVHSDPIEGAHKNGRTYLKPCLQSHAPIDLVILMLGTNDLKARFHMPPSEVAMGMGCLVHDIRELAPGPNGHDPEIMIVSPPPMLDDIKEWESIFSGAQEKSRKLALEFEVMADSLEVHFFDAGAVCKCAPQDGFHIDGEAHRLLGEALAQEVLSIGWAELHSAPKSSKGR